MATFDELLFGAKLEAWRHKMFHIFHFLQCGMVLGIVKPLKWMFNAISNEKSCLISMPFLSTYINVRTVNFFPPAESWLVNSNFPRASRMQGQLSIPKECSQDCRNYARNISGTFQKIVQGICLQKSQQCFKVSFEWKFASLSLSPRVITWLEPVIQLKNPSTCGLRSA